MDCMNVIMTLEGGPHIVSAVRAIHVVFDFVALSYL